MRILRFILLIIYQLMAAYHCLFAQTQQDSLQWYQLQIKKDLPLEEAAKNPDALFYTANRKLDSLRAVAVHVNVLSAAQIKSACVTNVPEALQLFPEFVVKSKANGLYNVEYRGSSAPSNQVGGTESLLLLVNAVPFNDALSGEIWWEALPYSIEDIERIELIRSPQGTWFGFGGALALVNIVTKNSTQTKGTHLKANLQVGTFNTHHYHAGLNMQLNDKLSARIAAFYQRRNRFQKEYYIQSLDRYLINDSILFYQPEAFRTNPDTRVAQNLNGVNISSAYKWNDSVYVRVNMASQRSEAQSAFALQEEIRATIRTLQTQMFDVRFHSPVFITQAFHRRGDRNYAVGYSGLQYHTSSTGVNVAYRKAINNYYITGGAEWLYNQYETVTSVSPGLMLTDSLNATAQWEQNLLSVYLQQKLSFNGNRLLIESGQRVYRLFEGQKSPFGYHLALRWYLTRQVSMQASAAQVLQSSNFIFEDHDGRTPVRITNYNLSLDRQINNKQGNIRLSVFNQQRNPVDTEIAAQDLVSDPMPIWGSTLEADYQLNRISLRASGSWFSSKQYEVQLHPSIIGSLQVDYTTFFDKLNVNTGLYFYGQHQTSIDSQLYDLSDLWLVNSRCSYRVWKDYELFLNIRNALNADQITVPQADREHRLVLLGFTIVL